MGRDRPRRHLLGLGVAGVARVNAMHPATLPRRVAISGPRHGVSTAISRTSSSGNALLSIVACSNPCPLQETETRGRFLEEAAFAELFDGDGGQNLAPALGVEFVLIDHARRDQVQNHVQQPLNPPSRPGHDVDEGGPIGGRKPSRPPIAGVCPHRGSGRPLADRAAAAGAGLGSRVHHRLLELDFARAHKAVTDCRFTKRLSTPAEDNEQ
jgi:hypothetical protein